MESRSFYSIEYSGTNWIPQLTAFKEAALTEIPVTWAVDWGSVERGKWNRSWMKAGVFKGYVRWHLEPGLDEQAYNVLLDHFGLENWKDEFPIERVIGMSPAQLIAIRREKEKIYNLPQIQALSHTFGDHYPAEEYD